LPSSTNKENELNNKAESSETTISTSATTLTSETNAINSNSNNLVELSESYQQQQHMNLVKNVKLNEDLVIGMQQPLTCSINSFGEENLNEMNLMSQQQQFFSYNKAIGSERETKPKATTQIQMIANKTNTSAITLLNAARSSSPYNLNESDSQQVPSAIKQQLQQHQANLNILGGLNSTQSNSSSSSSSPSPISSATSVNNNNNTSISLNRTSSLSTTTTTTTSASSGPNQSLLNKLSSQNAANLSLSGLTLNQPQQSVSQQQQTLQIAQLQQQQQQSQNLLNFNSSSLNINGVDLEKEKLKQDLLKKSEMCNKLEALCLQYRQVSSPQEKILFSSGKF
jgi:hypothetical protein